MVFIYFTAFIRAQAFIMNPAFIQINTITSSYRKQGENEPKVRIKLHKLASLIGHFRILRLVSSIFIALINPYSFYIQRLLFMTHL